MNALNKPLAPGDLVVVGTLPFLQASREENGIVLLHPRLEQTDDDSFLRRVFRVGKTGLGRSPTTLRTTIYGSFVFPEEEDAIPGEYISVEETAALHAAGGEKWLAEELLKRSGVPAPPKAEEPSGWTREWPREDGTYWHRADGGHLRAVYVFRSFLYYPGESKNFAPEHFPGLWHRAEPPALPEETP